MFYILTCGSTASMWLSRVLCYHPEVVCFHGVKTIPATAKPDPSEPLARQFVRELGRLYWLSKGEKVFGAIHGFGHAEIAPEIAAIDGALAAMIRHPITRLNSLFHREVANIGANDLPFDDVYRPLRENERQLVDITSDEPNPASPFGAYVRQFHELCRNTLTEDTFILERMDVQDIFRHEKIVTDPAYFRTCFERLAQGCRHAMAASTTRRGAVRLECDQDYVDRVFQMGHVNRKASSDWSVEEILAKWPELFKVIFRRELERQGGKDAVERYAGFGYRLPEEVNARRVRRSGAHPAHAAPSSPAMQQTVAARARVERERDALSAVPADAPSQGRPGPTGTPLAPRSSTRVRQMLAIIETERAAHAKLQDTLAAERTAFGARITELLDTLAAERAAFGARITELLDTLAAERAAFGARITELLDTLAAERPTFGARIAELEDTLAAERAAFGARITELQDTLAAERPAFGGRIAKLEDTLAAERDAFTARIKELEGALSSGTMPSAPPGENAKPWLGLDAISNGLANARRAIKK